jgi:hypothetical protein
MDALPNTTAGPPALPPMVRALSQRMENYARCVGAGMSYAEAFRQSGCVASSTGSMSRQIGDMNRDPRVRARINELRSSANAEVVSTYAERMTWLRMIVMADPNELTRVVRDPCDLCWPEAEIAKSFVAHFTPSPFVSERPALPDTQKPRHDCVRCRGDGVSRVVLTPTDELSPEGRALFKGATQDKDGAIKVQMHDQAVAADMLNRMQSAYVTRSLNINANVAVQPARDASPEDALKLFESFGQ